MKAFLVYVAYVALLSVALAQDTYEDPSYKFEYAVSDPLTGDHKSQSETRNGDIVQGYYQTLDPDGTYRTVTYVSDPIGGFRAQVSKGEPAATAAVAVPVVPKVAPAPVVVAPKPVAAAPVPVPVPAPIVPAASSVVPAYAPYPRYSAYQYYSGYPYYPGYNPYYKK